MSTQNYSNKQNVTFPGGPNDELASLQYKLQLSHLVLLMLISVLTVLGNTLVLVATWNEKSLHEPNKYFVASLAIADLLLGMVSFPIMFYRRFHKFKGETGSIHGLLCSFHTWIDAFAATASIYTLTFISFDRYLKIKKPLHYKSRMKTSTSFKVITIIFLISTTYATSFIFRDGGGCDGFSKLKEYFTFLSVAACFVPTVIMMTMYSLIFVVLHKRQKMLKNGELGQTFNDRNQRTAFLQDLKLIRMFVVVVGVFIFSWGSFFIWLMLIYYKPDLVFNPQHKKLMYTIDFVIFILPPMNSLCNPIIYACFDKKYRRGFKNLYQRLTRRPILRRQEPSNVSCYENTTGQ